MKNSSNKIYKFHYPLPKKFDILQGKYPDREKITTQNIENDDLIPFKKKRFMLVLEVIKKHNRVIVVYLTSLKKKHIQKGIGINQYVIEDPKEDETGLTVDTLMTFEKMDISSLKYNSRYFDTPYNKKEKKETPKVGHISDDDKIQIEEYLKHPKIAKIIKDLIDNPNLPMIL